MASWWLHTGPELAAEGRGGTGQEGNVSAPAGESSVNFQRAAGISLAYFYSDGDFLFIKILLKIEIQFCVIMFMEHFPALLPPPSQFLIIVTQLTVSHAHPGWCAGPSLHSGVLVSFTKCALQESAHKVTFSHPIGAPALVPVLAHPCSCSDLGHFCNLVRVLGSTAALVWEPCYMSYIKGCFS